MKIMQIIPVFKVAGAEIMCENLCVALKNAGEDVIAVSLYSEKTAITKRLEQNGIRIVYLNKKTGFDLTMITKLLKLFKDEKPDVVHTHIYASKYALPAAVLASIRKKVHTVHNIAQKEQGFLGMKINGFMYSHFNVVPVALSQEIKESIKSVYGLADYKIPVAFNGIDLSKCIVKNCYERNNPFTIIHIGRFMDVKNHKLLVQAFAKFCDKYQNVKLQLLGEGELLEEVKEMVKSLEIDEKVEFLGLQSNVYPYLNNADVFCLPSKYEGVPMTLIEAMGTGLPIIASNVGGIPDMLTNEINALLINPNKNELVSALDLVYNNLELRQKIGCEAKIRSKVFSAETMACRYLNIYELRG